MLIRTISFFSLIVFVWNFANPDCGGKRYKCGTEN